ncbi:endonuclease MutS2 [Gemelliphila palaticanis]|nr:endonuclease MutS2 [Gemella palaticanis]
MELLKNKINLDLVLKNVEDYCYSEISKKRFKNLPYIDNYDSLVEIHKKNEEVENLFRKYPNEFSLKIYDYSDSINKAKIESLLNEKELFYILKTIRTIRVFKNKFNIIQAQDNFNYNYISSYLENITDNILLENYLDKIVDEDGYIRSEASLDLLNIRTNIKKLKNKSENVLKQIIRKNISKLSEAIVTKRNDRDVILVKPEHKHDFGGIIHDESASGNTFYVEPRENVIINNEISILHKKEKEEILKILKEATEYVAENFYELDTSLKNFSEIEFIFSKINFFASVGLKKPNVINEQKIDLKKMYNPLIPKENVVKNDIYLDNINHSLIITGPNTGGKTVVLKTVAMCVVLTHLGLYIPALESSKIGFFSRVFVDIGDDQSIENNLSTFSSHMTNIVKILDKINNKSLVFFDELCSGTDPSEGTALSIAILNELKKQKVTVLCTTHYPEIKDYCFNSEYYINSSLEFDFDLLKPTYKFIMGLPGKSNAINISYKLGLSNEIINEANKYIKESEKENNSYIDKLYENIKDYEKKLEYVDNEIKEIDNIRNNMQEELTNYYKYKDSIYNELYEKFNSDIENKKQEMLDIYKNFKNNISLKQHEYNEVISSIDKLKPSSSKFNKEIIREKNDKLKIGDDVIVINYNQRATILSIKNDILQVKMGAMKLNLTKDDVKFIKKEKELVRSLTTTKNVSKNIDLSVNVIGKNTEEAIIEVENYIDKVLLTGYDTFTIIHGLGSGILKKNIGEYLKSSRYVASYRSGNQNEGGLGVTVVEVK